MKDRFFLDQEIVKIIIWHCSYLRVQLPDFLNSELVILWEADNRICQLSKKFRIRSSCALFNEMNGGQIVYYLPSELDQERDGAVFLKEFLAERRENMYIVRRSLEDENLSGAFFDFVAIPSLVLVSAILDNGTYRFVFLFHSSVLDSVSSHLLDISAHVPLMVEYLGKSRGMKQILGKIDESIPLLVMKSTGIAPDFETTPERNPIGSRWIRIIKITPSGENVSAVYFASTQPATGSGRMVHDGIFEAETRNPVTEYLTREDRKYGMIHLMRIHELNGRLLTVINIFPESFGNIPIKLLGMTALKFPEWKIQITGFWKFRDNPDSF